MGDIAADLEILSTFYEYIQGTLYDMEKKAVMGYSLNCRRT